MIQAIVEVMRPEPMQTICDPACGTGGFFLASYDYLSKKSNLLDRVQKRFLRYDTFHGTERFKPFSYDELMQRGKVNLDIFWLRDESLEDTDNLPEPDELAEEIVANLAAALEQFQDIYEA